MRRGRSASCTASARAPTRCRRGCWRSQRRASRRWAWRSSSASRPTPPIRLPPLDGAFIAARVLRARRVILYIGERHENARHAMLRALHERTEPERGLVTLAAAPARYVAGAETAAIHFLNEGIATPTTAPPLPFEQGVDRAPTLVQNVETLAHIALIARGGRPTSTLITLAGGIARPGVLEVELGTSIGDAVRQGGGVTEQPMAVLVGGYFGWWMDDGPGRGACRHPDGAVMFLSSALQVFGREFASHEGAHDLRRTA